MGSFFALVKDIVVAPGRVLPNFERRPSILLVVVLYLAISVGVWLAYPLGYERSISSTETQLQDSPNPQSEEFLQNTLEQLRNVNPRTLTLRVVGIPAVVLVTWAILILPLQIAALGRLLKGHSRIRWLIKDASLCFIVVIIGAVVSTVFDLLPLPDPLGTWVRGGARIAYVGSLLWFTFLIHSAVGLRYRESFEPEISFLRKFLVLNWIAWWVFRDPVKQRLASIRFNALGWWIVVATFTLVMGAILWVDILAG